MQHLNEELAQRVFPNHWQPSFYLELTTLPPLGKSLAAMGLLAFLAALVQQLDNHHRVLTVKVISAMIDR
jgi:hypothetical protein